ncbi:polysaccharide deacetylase [Stemphylium lycopersici]|nr:polysaccharide deacetylase [Stemphylium lycopersici]
MRSLILLPLFALLQICLAFVTPDIYSLTQPSGASPDLGASSRPPTVPSQSRLALALSLKTVGLQVKVIESLNISAQCWNLLIYTPPSVNYSPSSADVATLTSFVAKGGRLIFMSKVPAALQALAGVSASTADTSGSRSILQLTNTEKPVQALQGFDFTEYYDTNMPFYENYTSTGLVNVGYTPVKGAQTLGKYQVRKNGVDTADKSATSAAIVKNQPIGSSGYVYSFGMGLGYLYIQAQNEAGGYSPWYDGHYYPGYDIGTRIIKNIVTTGPHFASLWTVPYNKGLAFTTTWDIDTYVSYPHGQGMAAAAQDRGAAGNLNLHTKYITDAYESAYFQYGVPYIYQITGFRVAPDGYPFIDFGSHTVSHSPNAASFSYGTLKEQFIKGSDAGYAPYIHQCGPNADGTPPKGEKCIKGGTSGLSFYTSAASASGEVRVSAYLIRYVLQDIFKTNYNMTIYRPGNLAWSKYQASHCVANGIIGGSSCAGNSHLTHLPFQVTHNREPFQELPYYEFPLQWSDGDGNMSSADFPGSDFSNQIKYIKNMARYGGHYNILIHPSDAVFDKIQIQRALHDTVRPFAVFFNQTGIANWWTNRDRAAVTITAASNSAATMTVRLDGPSEGLTIQVPRNYAIKSATGSLSVCQQLSYDGTTNAVVLRNTAKGLYTLTFSVGSSNASVSTCPDFTPKAIGDSECIAWDVMIDDFLELYFGSNNVNLLLLQTIATGLASNNVDGTLQLTATTNSGVNSYYTEISRFCFDATLYTHLYFDMVAPPGATFYVQLVSYDSGCTTEAPSATYLDVTRYAAADGLNHTVTIPLSDFQGQDMLNVRAIRIGNISPPQTPIYIDNLKIQKRCVKAPGEDHTQGLAIESFQNVDRWITGINNVFGQTDHNQSMSFAKLSELGRMQLLPSNTNSFFYTDTAVNGVNLNATSYTAVSLNARGPSGGSFDVVLSSGASTNSTINTKSYATLSQDKFANITIPLSSFSGLKADSLSRITLRNFTPTGGSSASNFTVRWISLLGGSSSSSPDSRCANASGYVVLDFCDLKEFQTQTNALGAPITDGKTMQSYKRAARGSVDLVPRDAASYFRSSLAQSSNCLAVNGSYDAIKLIISGPQGGTADIGFKYGIGGCTTNVTTSYVPVTFNAASTQKTISFSDFPDNFDPKYMQSFVMTNFNSPGSTYSIYSLVFTGPADSPGCALCSGTILNTCTFVPEVPRMNRLIGQMTDEGSLGSYSVSSDGSLSMGTKSDAYWYSQFGSNTCYNANTVNATGLQISTAAPAGTNFLVSLRWQTNDECSITSPPVSVPMTSYVKFTDANSYQVARIPFADFPGINSSRLDSVAISAFNPSGVNIKIGCVSLISIEATPPSETCDCPSDAWLNYCTRGNPSRNAKGYAQSDDGTMEVEPVINNGALILQPSVSGSYWYSLQNCVDTSTSKYLYINVTAMAGASFNVQLQSGGNGCGGSTPLQRASVPSTDYAKMNGSPVLLSIPLSAYTAIGNSAFSLKTIDAVVLEGFGAETSTYAIHCAYFGSGAANTTST